MRTLLNLGLRGGAIFSSRRDRERDARLTPARMHVCAAASCVNDRSNEYRHLTGSSIATTVRGAFPCWLVDGPAGQFSLSSCVFTLQCVHYHYKRFSFAGRD